MMFRNKKGTDKPIEIFIALFVILVVAMVILKMFQSQISEKSAQLAEETQKEKINSLKKDLDQFCQMKCNEAGSSRRSQVQYCISYFETDPNDDLDGDGQLASTGDYIDEITDGLIGFCEDRIYCPAYNDDCGNLNPERCKEIVCEWMAEQNALSTDEELTQKVFGTITNFEDEYLTPGKCYDGLTKNQLEKHWFTNVIKMKSPFDGENFCYFDVGTCYGMRDLRSAQDYYGDDLGGWCLSFDDFADAFGATEEE
jgi:hypothetical protein